MTRLLPVLSPLPSGVAGTLTWTIPDGAAVIAGSVICEIEIEHSILEVTTTDTGILWQSVNQGVMCGPIQIGALLPGEVVTQERTGIDPLAESNSSSGRGRPPEVVNRIVREMLKIDPKELSAMKQEEMAVRFRAARSTCVDARKKALSKITNS
jgi:hypothetical protein